MYRLLFWMGAVAAITYLVARKRRFDWYSVAGLGAVVYFLPGFFGHVIDPDLKRTLDIEDETYLAQAFVFASIFIGAVVFDAVDRRLPPRRFAPTFVVRRDRYVPAILVVLALVCLAMAVVEMGSATWAVEKEVGMERQGRWMIGYEFAACLALLTNIAFRHWRSAALTSLLIAPSLFFGSRTALVLSAIAAVTMHLRQAGPIVLIRRWRYVLAGSAALYGTMLFKQFQFALKYGTVSGDWGMLYEQAQDGQSYVDALFNSEPFLVQNTLNEVVRTDFSTGIEQLEGLLGAVVPFGNEIGLSSRGFNDLFQPTLFPDVEYGLASNIWAQAYSLGGLGIVLLFCAVFTALVLVINRWHFHAQGSVGAAVGLSGAYWAFYIHRNDLLYQFLLQRRVIVLFVLAWSVSWILTARARIVDDGGFPRRRTG